MTFQEFERLRLFADILQLAERHPEDADVLRTAARFIESLERLVAAQAEKIELQAQEIDHLRSGWYVG